MRRSSGFSQLIKGLVIGIVLILAIVGSMSLLNDNQSSHTTEQVDSPPVTIEAPLISMNPNSEKTTSETGTEVTQADLTENTSEVQQPEIQTDEGMKPVLEGEKTEEEIKAEQEATIQYGLLKLSTINPQNKEKLKANFAIYDLEDKKIAESTDTDNASYRLATGKYKVVTTLSKTNNETGRSTPLVQKSQYITIVAETITNKEFKLEPPSINGVLQVAAIFASNKQPMKANFIIQKENGETVATRNNVTNSLFKLKAGSYKVTVRSGNNSDFRTVVVEAGESADEIFKLQESFSQGRVLVRIFDTQSSTPVRGDIAIITHKGKIVQELKAVSRTEISLSAGSYKIQVTGPNGQSSKIITVTAGQALNEIFRFDAPSPDKTPEQSTQVTDNVTIKAVDQSPDEPDNITQNNQPVDETNDISKNDETSNDEAKQQEQSTQGSLRLFARNAENGKPLKSNFYIQTTTGKHLAKKVYADSAKFFLKPGTYKVTVRSKNRKNLVKTIRITANQNINDTFSLTLPNAPTARPLQTLAPPKPVKNPAIVPNGFLKVAMLPTGKLQVTKNSLNTHFIVTKNSGQKVVELTSVPSGNFKLDIGTYVVTAIYKNKRRTQKVKVRTGKTTQVNFNSGDFQTTKQKGVLRSRIVNSAGQPLKANLIVTNMRGQVVARANDVSTGVFDLPPAPYNINIKYQGLNSSEIVHIVTGETTVQTFTVAPNNAPPSKNTPVRQPNRDKNDKLKDKLKEELHRIF